MTSGLNLQEKVQSLWSRLTEVCAWTPDKTAVLGIDDEGRERTSSYIEMVEGIARLSENLVQIGIERGDRVALIMTNRIDWVYCFFAIQRIGAVVVPINTRLQPHEMSYILRNSRTNHVVVLDQFRSRNYSSDFAQICGGWAGANRNGVMSAALPDLRNVVIKRRESVTERSPDVWDLDELCDEPSPAGIRDLANAAEHLVDPETLGMIKYTSGSTGFPKGVILSQAGCVRAALLATDRLGIGSKDRWFSAAPFFHVGGSVWSLLTAILSGGMLVFTETHEPELSLRYAERESCTIIYGVPAMIRDLMAELRGTTYELDAVRLVSATDKALAEEVQRRIPSVTTPINAFGLTETFGPFAVLSPTDTWDKKVTTCGRLLPGNEMKVIDPDSGLEVEPGRVGEGLLRGGVTTGYWDAEGETASAIDQEGWFHSGDLVTMDALGYVTWVGRLKAMLKIGGENVSAEEVENCLQRHPAILLAVVVGIPDPRLDEVACAFVVTQKDESVSTVDLATWCQQDLARFKVPKQFRFVSQDEIPMTGSGKVDRAKVQALAFSRS
jgi:fatty-acyl-CoA synthase